jgi:bla regulator protein BlaR1
VKPSGSAPSSPGFEKSGMTYSDHFTFLRQPFGVKLLVLDSRRKAMRSLALTLMFGMAVIATPAAPQDARRAFEVALVKPSSSGRPGTSIETDPGRFKAINATVRFLIMYAYGIKDFQLTGGPGWIGSETYDIEAKSDIKTGDREFPVMTQTLLADRFQLKFHRETRELPVYSLVLAKNGPKLAPAPEAEDKSTRGNGRGELTIKNGKVANLASALSNILGRTVVDNTGLTGSYDLTLKWTPDEYQPPPLRPNLPPADPNGPSIFTALQEQLGLKLESTKGPIAVLVVDSAQKPEPN